MRTFIIILFIFFIFFLIISLFVFDPLPFFLVIFLAFLIAFVCLTTYLGPGRGLFIGIIFIFMPFLIEYLLAKYNIPFSQSPTIRFLTLRNINLQITLTNLFSVLTIPLLFITALFFTQKIKLLANVKNLHKTFLIICTSFLVSLNFLSIKQNVINYQNFLKWLMIALLVNLLLVKLYKFKIQTSEIYKELPIILYLAIYGAGALKRLDTFNLIITALLTFFYLILLYNEYRIRKINLPF